jgi:hypothetical protein
VLPDSAGARSYIDKLNWLGVATAKEASNGGGLLFRLESRDFPRFPPSLYGVTVYELLRALFGFFVRVANDRLRLMIWPSSPKV